MKELNAGNLFERTSADGYWERVARAAVVASCRAVEQHRTRFSRKDFSQPQLLAILVLMKLNKATYRGIVALLEAMPGVRDMLGISRVPHWSTLHKFATRRCTIQMVNDILACLARDLVEANGGGHREQAMDSTGIDSSCASRDYRGRTGILGARYFKASVAVICGMFLPTTVIADWGPTLDKEQAVQLGEQAVLAVPTSRVLADRGYDLEELHAVLREKHGVDTAVPPVPRWGQVKSKYRSTLQGTIPGYGRRWHVETFMSTLKRRTGPATNARGATRPLIDTAVKVLATAIHIAPDSPRE
ncbi:MAG: transposase [Phycisphaerales bacterium]|nr:transposase [Phycisphaerales bacterium]